MPRRQPILIRRKFLRPSLLLAATLLLPSCFSLQHTVGRGPQTKALRQPSIVQDTRWFGLFGLWPLSDEDCSRLVGPDVKDYRVTTTFTAEDVLVSAFTSFATFYRQTVIVEK